MESSHVALIILVITMVMFVWGKVPLVLTAICSALAMGILGVIPYATVFSGFSNATRQNIISLALLLFVLVLA